MSHPQNIMAIYQIGDPLPDGWLLGPFSSAAQNAISIAPIELRLKGPCTFNELNGHIDMLHNKGHEGVRSPTPDEVKTIFNYFSGVLGNRPDIKLERTGRIWTSKTKGNNIIVIDCDYNTQYPTDQNSKNVHSLIVRDEPFLKMRFIRQP